MLEMILEALNSICVEQHSSSTRIKPAAKKLAKEISEAEILTLHFSSISVG